MHPSVTPAVAADLSQIELFQGLPADALPRLAIFGRKRTFTAGSVLMRQGDSGECLYAILTGRVRLEHRPLALPRDAAPEVLAEVGAGEVVGGLSLFERQASVTTAIAIDEVHVLQISYVAVALIVLHYPEVVTPLLDVVRRRAVGERLALRQVQTQQDGLDSYSSPSGGVASVT